MQRYPSCTQQYLHPTRRPSHFSKCGRYYRHWIVSTRNSCMYHSCYCLVSIERRPTAAVTPSPMRKHYDHNRLACSPSKSAHVYHWVHQHVHRRIKLLPVALPMYALHNYCIPIVQHKLKVYTNTSLSQLTAVINNLCPLAMPTTTTSTMTPTLRQLHFSYISILSS